MNHIGSVPKSDKFFDELALQQQKPVVLFFTEEI